MFVLSCVVLYLSLTSFPVFKDWLWESWVEAVEAVLTLDIVYKL